MPSLVQFPPIFTLWSHCCSVVPLVTEVGRRRVVVVARECNLDPCVVPPVHSHAVGLIDEAGGVLFLLHNLLLQHLLPDGAHATWTVQAACNPG